MVLPIHPGMYWALIICGAIVAVGCGCGVIAFAVRRCSEDGTPDYSHHHGHQHMQPMQQEGQMKQQPGRFVI